MEKVGRTKEEMERSGWIGQKYEKKRNLEGQQEGRNSLSIQEETNAW